MRSRFCRISCSSPRVRRRPGRWRRASVVEGGAQAAERLLPPGVAEVVEPGGGHGGGGEVLGLERDHGAPVVAQAAPECHHLVRPRAARRGDPGHGRHRTRRGGEWPHERAAGAGDERPPCGPRRGRDGRAAGRRRRLPLGPGDPRRRSSSTPCRRRRCWRTSIPATTSWPPPGWCTTSATSCPGGPTRPTPATPPRGAAGAGGAGGRDGGDSTWRRSGISWRRRAATAVCSTTTACSRWDARGAR